MEGQLEVALPMEVGALGKADQGMRLMEWSMCLEGGSPSRG
jgi:hypothetical protein